MKTWLPALVLAAIFPWAAARAGCPNERGEAGEPGTRAAALIECLQAIPQRTAGEEYDYAMALADLGRRAEAAAALRSGQRLAPADKRFPTELAGLAFLDERYAEAVSYLKRALRLDADDPYLIDFLATVYLLQGNLDAALHNWNRIGKPRIEQIDLDPRPRTDAVLLDRAFAFAPAEVLHLSDLELTRARLRHLDVFAQQRFDLVAREDQRFDLRFQAAPRSGWRDSKLGAALAMLRGLPYQTVQPEFFDADGHGLNVQSLARWDPKKRRLSIALSRPVGRDPGRRWGLFLDGRDEDWRFGSNASADVAAGFGLQKLEAGAEFSSIVNSRLTWRTRFSLASRHFDRAPLGSDAPAPNRSLFREGTSLDYLFGLNFRLLHVPEHRVTLDAAADWRLGRFWAADSKPYSQWNQGLTLEWFPLASGDDYHIEARFRSGQTFGAAPFDDLYALGMERDNDLWLRGHPGTAGGYKGAALLGDRYLLANWELDKLVYRHPFLKVTAGPFLDTGGVHDPAGVFGSSGWQWDSGLQCKLTLAGDLIVAFSYGRNLQSGRDAFYWQIRRR